MPRPRCVSAQLQRIRRLMPRRRLIHLLAHAAPHLRKARSPPLLSSETLTGKRLCLWNLPLPATSGAEGLCSRRNLHTSARPNLLPSAYARVVRGSEECPSGADAAGGA